MTYWGYHLILDVSNCYGPRIRSSQNIVNFSKSLVHNIDMVAYGKPRVVKFGSGNKAGYTLVQLIETSNICAHFVEETNDMYLDVFSCKPFNPSDVESVVEYYFCPEHISRSFLTRQARVENGSKLPILELK
jgi:S-adenosylmethionine/arginine decarboxylase-like enzyme